MPKKNSIDKIKLLQSLEINANLFEDCDGFAMEQMSLAKSILNLADINQEKEYLLCRKLAEQILEKVPEPEDIDIQ